MLQRTILILLVGGVMLFTSCDKGGKSDSGTEGITLATKNDSVNYALGLNFAENLTKQGFDSINNRIINKAFDDVVNENDYLFSMQDAGRVLQTYFQKLQQKKFEKNKSAGEKFLSENKNKEGIKTTPSGIQYKILKEGTGESPTPESKVTCHYHGTLIDGTVFDSSVERGKPAQFPVNGVIKGWQEILPMMKEGGKWKIFVPQELAYGENPRPGGAIEPYMTLIFEIELVSVDE